MSDLFFLFVICASLQVNVSDCLPLYKFVFNYVICVRLSSIHVYLCFQHVESVWSTWMTSCVQLRKSNSWTFRTGILRGEWRPTTHVKKEKKKGMFKICSKSMCTHNKGANEQTLKTELRNTVCHSCLLNSYLLFLVSSSLCLLHFLHLSFSDKMFSTIVLPTFFVTNNYNSYFLLTQNGTKYKTYLW